MKSIPDMRRRIFIFAALVALSRLTPAVLASSEDSGFKAREHAKWAAPVFLWRPSFAPALELRALALDPETAFRRAQAVLEHFGVPAEEDSQSFFSDLQDQVTADSIRAVLSYLDSTGRFGDYGSFVQLADGNTELRIFQDPGSKQVLDYSVRLSESAGDSADSFHARLLAASSNPAGQPLGGLRIALDPGHMGGDFWDRETGKFVRDERGNKLSEGVLAVQIALLLEEKLQAAGAQVLITHRTLGPVSTLDYGSFELRPFGLNALRASVGDDWFSNLISQNAPGSALYSSFSSSRDFRSLFAESKRWRYFILGADLDARVEMIERFQPDITLVIHLDATEPAGDSSGVNPRGYNGTKAYVPGGFLADEFATRSDRRFFGRHLVDTAAWSASVGLSRAVVNQIRNRLGVRLDPSDGGNSRRVEPGVLARNLNLSRKLTHHAVSYVECLFYNDPAEFAALLDARNSMTIDGEEHPYSDRLAMVSDALNEAVVRFVREYKVQSEIN